jgi:hypothetical protein
VSAPADDAARGRDTHVSRRALLVGCAGTAGCGWWSASPTARQRAVAWLASKQAPDGGWHSEVYGLFRGGASLTALAALALQAQPDPPEDALDRALAFLVASRDRDGALGIAEVTDYPMYATAMAATAIARAGRLDGALISSGWIARQQLRGEAWGDHPARGGFPMGASTVRTPPHSGHVDLSMTRRAIEALHACGVTGEAMDEARRFVLGCRTADGSFRYSPVDLGTNKGRDPEAGYGTATADAVLALRATGGAEDAVRDGVAWLVRSFRADENPGIGDGPLRVYARAMRFDWRSSVACVFVGGGGPEGWAHAIRSALEAEQLPDGSWRNERAEQKEDDPLVATALAVEALGAIETNGVGT